MNMHGSADPVDRVEFKDGARRRRVLWIGALVVIVVAAAAAWFLLGAKGPPPAAPVEPPSSVTVVVPGQTAIVDAVRVTGSIAARRELPVGVQGEGGMVRSVLVQEGDRVRRGQVLVRIDRAVQAQQVVQMTAGIRQAEADAALAEAELVRAQNLVQRGFISKADIDRKTATRDSAAARVAVARAQAGEMNARVARLDIRAPDDGIVLTRAVEPGQVVGAGGMALFRIAQDSQMEMRAAVAEQDLARLRVGQSATVQLVGSADTFTGKVWLIEPLIDPQARQGAVRIAIGTDRRLRPGAFSRGTIDAGSITRPQLPQSAVQSDEVGNYVFVVGPDDRVQRRSIEVGAVGDNGIAIRSGLSGTERVVASAAAFLSPGEKVTPVRRSAR